MAKQFDYQGAKQAGYSDDEISAFLGQQQPKYEIPNESDTFGSRIGKNISNFIGNFGNPTGQVQESPQDAIDTRLLEKHPKFDFNSAIKAGYSPQEVNEFLSNYQPERSAIEKGGRLGAQFGLGVLQGAPSSIAYDIATAPLASKEAQTVKYRENLFEDIERLQEQKQTGVWDQQDQELLDNLVDQVRNPEKMEPFVKTADVTIHGLAQKAAAPFGIDLTPEGTLEKAANWAGFIKNPQNIKNLFSIGLTPKTLTKAIFPAPTEAIRGLAAGAALQMAEEGNFGPAGTLAATIAADLAGHVPKGLFHVATHPKQALAQATNLFAKMENRLGGGNSDKKWLQELVKDANEAGVQLDAGTLTNSNVLRMAQARAAQSGLSGPALDEFRKNLSQQIIRQYEGIVDELGTLTFENNHQAAEAIRGFVTKEEKSLFQQPFSAEEQKGARPLAGRIAVEEQPNYQQEFLNRIAPQEFESSYQAGETLKTAAEDIKTPIKEDFSRRWEDLNREVETLPAGPQAELARVIENFIEEQQGSLLLGESSAENRVLQAATRLRDALMTEDGALIGVALRDLIKTKRTLGDIANWEFGGSNFQSAYKQLVGELDRAIERTLGRVNPELREAYEQLNAEYSMFKDIFENKNVLPLFEPKNQNYNTIYSGFLKNPDKLRSLEDLFWDNPRGQQLIGQVKRDYAQRVVESPNLTARDLRNLQNVLGPQSEGAIREFILGRQHALEHPLPRAARQPVIGARVELPAATPGKSLTGRGVPSAEHARRKLYEYIKAKSSDQILKMMDTVEGIHRLKKALSLTEGGKELFDQLARYKLSELIDKNMTDNLKENVKLGTFSGLLKSSKNQAIVHELIGSEAFTQFRRLQKISGRLQASAEKFYNASKSGTTLVDAGLVSTAISGVFTGNFYLAIPAMAKIGGIQAVGRLLTDAQFLKYLEQAALADNKKKFIEILNKMQPSASRAIVQATQEAREER